MAKLSSTNFAAIGKHPIDWKSFLDAKAVKDFYIIMLPKLCETSWKFSWMVKHCKNCKIFFLKCFAIYGIYVQKELKDNSIATILNLIYKGG